MLPADASGNVKDAILFAHAFLKKGSRDRVVVVSDGAFTGAEEFSRESAHLRFIRTPGGAENLGIVGLGSQAPCRRLGALRSDGAGAQLRRESRARAAHAGAGTRRSSRARKSRSRPVAGASSFIPIDGDPAGTLTAQLEIDDDFATDNRATLTVSAAAPLRLLYVGPGNPALSNLLRFFPNVQLTAVTSWQPDASRREGGRGTFTTSIIFDRVAAPELTEGNVILINTVAPNLPLEPSRAKCERRVSARRWRSTRSPRA